MTGGRGNKMDWGGRFTPFSVEGVQKTKKEFINLVNKIRSILPNCSITTDIIVGFPGETDSDFSETLEMMKINELRLV